MTVENALRVACRPRGVAQRHRRPLIQFGPFVCIALCADQGLIGDGILQRRFGHVLVVGHDDITLDGGRVPGNLLKQRHKHRIGKDPLVLGVVDDENDLLGKKPRINRVTDVPRPADAVIHLEVPVVVPGKRGDPIPFLQSQLVQCIRQLPCAAAAVGKGVTMQWVVRGHRDDFAMRVVALRVSQNH